MKNVKNTQMKKCIILSSKEFEGILDELFDCAVTAEYSLDGLTLYTDDDCIDIEELCNKLAEYFDVDRVTSVHIDDCDDIGVWICYQDGESELVNLSSRIAVKNIESVSSLERQIKKTDSFVEAMLLMKKLSQLSRYLEQDKLWDLGEEIIRKFLPLSDFKITHNHGVYVDPLYSEYKIHYKNTEILRFSLSDELYAAYIERRVNGVLFENLQELAEAFHQIAPDVVITVTNEKQLPKELSEKPFIRLW